MQHCPAQPIAIGGFSNTFLTDNAGLPYQMFLNLPFGETMAEQKTSGYYNNAYKFNGKEQDAETGLYYYGARYYDPRSSVWLNVDPIMESRSWLSLYNSVKLPFCAFSGSGQALKSL